MADAPLPEPPDAVAEWGPWPESWQQGYAQAMRRIDPIALWMLAEQRARNKVMRAVVVGSGAIVVTALTTILNLFLNHFIGVKVQP